MSNQTAPVQHAVRFHARLSASRVARVALCAGSLMAEDALPETPSGEAADRGTAIHEIAELLLTGQDLPAGTPSDLLAVAEKYVHEVREQTKGAKLHFVELNVTDALKTLHPWLGGTADYVAIGGGTLTVVDLKTGRIDVEPRDNVQLLTYALGAALALSAPNTIKVRLCIYQPESGGWKEFWCDYGDLMDWRDSLLSIARSAGMENAPRTPGVKACQYCRARAQCPDLTARAVQAARRELLPEGSAITREMLDDAALCLVWANEVQHQGRRQLIDKPQSVPGWAIKDGRKMTAWRDEKMAAAMFADNPLAFDLKSVSALRKLGLEVPPSLVNEKRTAGSLVRS